jgi:hypothetical protein
MPENPISRPVDYLPAKLHYPAGAVTAPGTHRTTTNPRARHATSPGQKPGPTRITVLQDVYMAGPSPTRYRATVRYARRPARRTHQLPHQTASQLVPRHPKCRRGRHAQAGQDSTPPNGNRSVRLGQPSPPNSLPACLRLELFAATAPLA